MNTSEQAKLWIGRLESRIGFYKVGLELFLNGGFSIVNWIIEQGHEVMLDLKFFDVPQTVASAVRQSSNSGVSLITVHGNDAMLEAAVRAGGANTILAVTVLTSLDQGDLKSLGFACTPEELVVSRAQRALDLGCRGVVSSGLELPRIRKRLGQPLLVVVPGVRPISNSVADDQKRTVDPQQAIIQGADHIVLGRPIRQAGDPLGLVEQMQEQIQQGLQQKEKKQE